MSRTLASSLNNGLNRLKKAEYAIERNIAIAELEPYIVAAIDALNDRKPSNTEYLTAIVRLLAAVGKGRLFPGMKNYIKNTREFDAAIEQLRGIVGEVEEISIKTTGRR